MSAGDLPTVPIFTPTEKNTCSIHTHTHTHTHTHRRGGRREGEGLRGGREREREAIETVHRKHS